MPARESAPASGGQIGDHVQRTWLTPVAASSSLLAIRERHIVSHLMGVGLTRAVRFRTVLARFGQRYVDRVVVFIMPKVVGVDFNGALEAWRARSEVRARFWSKRKARSIRAPSKTGWRRRKRRRRESGSACGDYRMRALNRNCPDVVAAGGGFLSPLRGSLAFVLSTHGLRRGLHSFAAFAAFSSLSS
jgi:hypothetical protein